MVSHKKRSAKHTSKPSTPDNDDDENDAKALSAIGDWLDRQEIWERDVANAPYNGIRGTLPDWIPLGSRKEFLRLRHNLLGVGVGGVKITPEVALQWIDAYANLGEPEEDGHIPEEYFEVVGQLSRFRYIVSLGEKKGLRELGVPSAAFLGRKMGAREPETVYLARLIKKHHYEGADDLYRMLRVIAGTPGDKRNPTPGQCPFDADNRGVQPVLLKRGREFPIGTFRNRVSQIRKLIEAGEFADD